MCIRDSLLRDHLLTPSIPLPADPIGIGAKWEIASPQVADGMRTNQAVVYELESLEKGKGKASVQMRISAPEQDIDGPGAPGQPHLKQLDGSGKGSSTFDLGKVSARSFGISVSSKATVSVSLMGNDIAGEMTSKSDTKRTGK